MDTAKKGCLLNVLLFVLGAVVGTGMTAVLAVLAFLPGRDTISANTGDPGVWVKEVDTLLGAPEYEVWLGRSEDHGHVVEVPAGWGHEPEVVRTAEGVELRFPHGGRIFVPASTYVGGR